MSNILMPTPGPERRTSPLTFRLLRAKLEQQRRLCIQRLADLAKRLAYERCALPCARPPQHL